MVRRANAEPRAHPKSMWTPESRGRNGRSVSLILAVYCLGGNMTAAGVEWDGPLQTDIQIQIPALLSEQRWLRTAGRIPQQRRCEDERKKNSLGCAAADPAWIQHDISHLIVCRSGDKDGRFSSACPNMPKDTKWRKQVTVIKPPRAVQFHEARDTHILNGRQEKFVDKRFWIILTSKLASVRTLSVLTEISLRFGKYPGLRRAPDRDSLAYPTSRPAVSPDVCLRSREGDALDPPHEVRYTRGGARPIESSNESAGLINARRRGGPFFGSKFDVQMRPNRTANSESSARVSNGSATRVFADTATKFKAGVQVTFKRRPGSGHDGHELKDRPCSNSRG
ncbi:hypothetical protein C8R47DRAFT_1082828 [Mycena vitilis]|nr:hypothetical protein C8R47DRAFT_1082828 [Mycena vitilis]